MHAGARAQLPHAGVGLVVQQPGLLAHRFQSREVRGVGATKETVVVEGLRRAENDVAVDVVLEVLVRLVADAHRAHAPVSRQVGHDRLGQGLLQADAVERLDVTRLRAAQHVVEPAQIVLHGSDLGQAVQRANDEERIAQPAEAIVPVAPAVRRFRNARRHGGDDGARLLELTELERDGGADHRLLPLQRNGEAARPGAPVEGGLLLEFPGGLVDASGQRLVGTEQQAHRRVQREPGAFGDIGRRRARRQPQRAARKHVAQVIAAARDHRRLAGPLAERPDADADARVPRQRADPANQLRRAENPVAMEEARREVGDLHASSFGIEQAGPDDRGAVLVALLDAAQAFELDAHPAIRPRPRRAGHGTRDRHRTGACSTRRWNRDDRRGRRSHSCRSAPDRGSVRHPEAPRQESSWPHPRQGFADVEHSREYTMMANSRGPPRLGGTALRR